MNPTRAIGVIPARWASTRFPGKILAPLCGHPLIHWVIKRAREAERLDEVLVATDDDRIYAAIESEGVRAVMTRPDHPSGTDRIAEAISDEPVDVVINIQGDEPLVEPALIDQLVDVLAGSNEWDMATASAPIEDEETLLSPSVVKVVSDAKGRALYFSRSPIPHVRDGGHLQGIHWRHIGLYGYQAGYLRKLVTFPPCDIELAEKLEQLRALDQGCRMKVLQTRHMGIGVDEPEDIPRAEDLLKEAGLT